MSQAQDSSVEKMLQYCSGIADEFDARLNRVRNYGMVQLRAEIG
jgi:hypothetical protein